MPSEYYTTASVYYDGSKRYWTGKITNPNCPGTLGRHACWTYLTHIGHSDGGGIQDLALAQQIKDRVHQVANLSVRNRPPLLRSQPNLPAETNPSP